MLKWLRNLLNGEGVSSSQSEDDTGDKARFEPQQKPFEGLEGIRFGRYSDNNKPYEKTKQWYVAEDRFKEKRYQEYFDALFDYMKDDEAGNVSYRRHGDLFKFTIYQGSKKIYGENDGEKITAKVPLAQMTKPSTAVMRRMLDMNYALYYSRTALSDEDVLYMMFDTPVSSASPNKMYYGLKELSTKADRQDDLLVDDFASLQPVDVDHIVYAEEQELTVKYRYFRKWIEDALTNTEILNQNSYAGPIAYTFLGLIYRLDYLVAPEAKLMTDIEKVHSMYWEKKDDIPLTERNQMLREGLRKLLEISKEDFKKYIYHSKSTFSITSPPKAGKVREHISEANKDAKWCLENKQNFLAEAHIEYGLLYNLFIYNMPEVLRELTKIFMAVVHHSYFRDLGMEYSFRKEDDSIDEGTVEYAVNEVMNKYADKYPKLKWDNENISYKNLCDFSLSFTDEIAHLNTETKQR